MSSRMGVEVLGSVGLSYAVLAVGSVAVVVFLLVPPGSVLQLLAWSVPFVLGTVVLAARTGFGPSSIRAPLVMLLAGALLYFGASLVWYVGPVWLGYDLGFPSPLDAVYFVAYLLYAGFLGLCCAAVPTTRSWRADLLWLTPGFLARGYPPCCG